MQNTHLTGGSHGVVLGPAQPGHLLETETLKPYLRPSASESSAPQYGGGA